MAIYMIHNKKGIVKIEADTVDTALDLYVTGTLCAKKVFGLTNSSYNTVKTYLKDGTPADEATEVKAKLINGCCTTSAYKITAISSVSEHTKIEA